MAPAHIPTWLNPALGRLAVFAAGISRILGCNLSLAVLVMWSATGVAREPVAGTVTCEIRPCTGRPTLFFAGEPRFPMAFNSYYPQPFRYKNMADHGVHAYVVILTLTDKWLGGDKPVKWNTRGLWREQDTIDYPVIEKSLQEVLDADPQAIVLLRIFCDSPAWWDLLHPGETDGGGKPGSQGLRQSFSSLRWRNDAAAALKNIVRFVSSSKFGRHVFGYMPTVGDTEEAAKECDETACAQERFREWLSDRYGNDGKTVQRLFGKGLEAISIPSAAHRSAGDCGHFLDPQKSQLVIDYRQFHSDQIVDSILALCRAVKEASEGRLITGTFYGYTRYWPDRGHLALRRLLKSKDIDFVTTAGGQGATETGSVLKAGKLFYSEIDTHTSLCQWISKTRPDIDPQGCYNEARWFGPPTIADSLRDLKKVFAKNLVHGWANWWFDLWGGWYDNEAILQFFAEAQRVGDESIHLSRKSVAQVAVVLDENSFRYVLNISGSTGYNVFRNNYLHDNYQGESRWGGGGWVHETWGERPGSPRQPRTHHNFYDDNIFRTNRHDLVFSGRDYTHHHAIRNNLSIDCIDSCLRIDGDNQYFIIADNVVAGNNGPAAFEFNQSGRSRYNKTNPPQYNPKNNVICDNRFIGYNRDIAFSRGATAAGNEIRGNETLTDQKSDITSLVRLAESMGADYSYWYKRLGVVLTAAPHTQPVH